MRLSKVEIQNFRSIKEDSIDFSPRCRILVGINESGKSNILRALSLLGNGQDPRKDDIRQCLPDEPPVQDAWVDFIFELNEDDVTIITQNVLKKVLALNLDTPILKQQADALSLGDFCRNQRQGLYRVNIIKSAKFAAFWQLANGYEVLPQWKKPSPQCPPPFVSPGADAPLKAFLFVNAEDMKDIPAGFLADLVPSDVNDAVGEEIKKLVVQNLPEMIYWTYDEANLLPAQLNLTQFAAKPEMCVPLKHMFALAGVGEIQKDITEAKAVPHRLRNLLNRVADRATAHLQSVWKEYKGLRLQLSLNGDNVDASVTEDFNHYDLSRRSDGFKRFVTFLLMISCRVKTKTLQNALLLIDEPEIGLHPSGCRYLCDELVRISENNNVAYSTHSVSMIDRDSIERHLLVKKAKEVTAIIKADESNIFDEEVIFNALGHSIFESLKKQNILFEGWRDKKLFQTASATLPKTHKSLKRGFDEVGLCHSKGVKDIRNITPLLELANRRCLIVSDNDAVAKEKQREHVASRGYGSWHTYGDLLPGVAIATAEDFVKPGLFRSSISTLRKSYPELPELTDVDLCGPNGKLYALRLWLKEHANTAIPIIKDAVFEKLTVNDIEPMYYDFMKALAKQIDAQNTSRQPLGCFAAASEGSTPVK